MKYNVLIIFIIPLFIISCSRDIKDEVFKKPTTPIILISMDGFRWDYFDKTETPSFDILINNGSKAESLIPVFPTKTFPNHITIVSGNYPQNHGIIANRMYDPIFDEDYYIGQGSKPVLDGKWYEAEPVWVTVEKSGLKAMTMFWPASDAKIMGYRPTEFFEYDGSVKHDDRIRQVLKWLDYPDHKRPSLITLYFSHTDTYGHKYGPNSKETIDAIVEMDRTMGLLIEGLKQRNIFEDVNILLVSDHGMAETHEDSVLFLDDRINLDDVRVVDWTPVGSLIPNTNIELIYDKLKNSSPMLDVYKKGETPERLYYNNHRRIQPITLIAKEHWSISSREYYSSDDHAQGYNGGTHGYDPAYRSMHGIFVGHGPAFKNGYVGKSISSIHLYEMMCKILKIKPATNDGSLDSTIIFLKK